MVTPELGTKRTCPNCATRFYDLLKNPITCPKCGTSFIAQSILPSKGDLPGMAPAAAPPKPRVEEQEEEADTGEVELVSLEDAEEPDKDDETAGIEDVDLGEEAEGAGNDEEEDDTFLVEEEEEGGSMDGLIEGGGKEDEEES